ncbi:phosphatase PAP2 family protein [Cohnella nanjingensis]|uniref:Phosphatase PAP2 family protein n=1 Tax=Cohnella nanjingensis TaxID=1387779 RepID=A0A7X0RYV4_9BACL|nr:phosphatase PAP2 family protein [Cohnella nanjingensis]MBB6675001.1 phosphatase PAP2 family protein [Cohnella nanjingensis]
MTWKLRGKKYAPLLGMLIFPILGAIYALTNKVDDKVYHLMTPLDHAIPFVKYFALPYAVWIFYIYVCIVYFYRKDLRVYYRSLIVYTLSALACYLVYSVFQTTVPRPVLTGEDPFTRLVSYLYHRDQPYNCFPSIHSFSSYMVFRLLAGSKFRSRLNLALVGSMSGLIILSTLFIKQHAIMDVLAAVLLVEVVIAVVVIAERLVARQAPARERSRGTYGA